MSAVVSTSTMPLKAGQRYRIGIWVAISGILMLFVSLVSAFVVRSASSNDWRAVAMPKLLWVSTAILIVSSVTMEIARRSFKTRRVAYSPWLIATAILGLAFVVLQFVAWRQLVSAGVYLAGNPYNSFFYLFTATHGLHLSGGLGALVYLLVKLRRDGDDQSARNIAAADTVTTYWHFMDILWIALFMLLMFWK